MASAGFSTPWLGLRKPPPFIPTTTTATNFTRRPFKPRPSTVVLAAIPCRSVVTRAGRSKKQSTGRIEGDAEYRREAKRQARRKSRRLAENLFYRLNNPGGRLGNHADNFSEEELQMIGLGYDRMVRFMDGPDDPRLRHPHDWYKYGRFGPFSWRGIVVGTPIRGRSTDECVTLISDVRDHEEWARIEQFELSEKYGRHVRSFNQTGPGSVKYYWVFVRHPKWRITELPWEQWTLVSEVALETGNKRVDKWSLMGRLGNSARSLVTKCAAWMRPDIIYVEKPVYQCRFEPQEGFFRPLGPLLDPASEGEYKFEAELDGGKRELCTYYGGLCKMVKVNPKAFVDDVVKAYEKMSDERKSKCLEFLLTNHPVEFLHPYTREWKAKLEEEELGCDAPDDSEDEKAEDVVNWIVDDEEDDSGLEEEDDGEEDVVVDVGDDDELLGVEEERDGPEETQEYWDEQFNKAMKTPQAMEQFVTKTVERNTEIYKRQLKYMEEARMEKEMGGDAAQMPQVEGKPRGGDWRDKGRGGRKRRVKKSRVPPELFLRAAVRMFTYRNLVKEIVLMRHAIIDGEIGGKW